MNSVCDIFGLNPSVWFDIGNKNPRKNFHISFHIIYTDPIPPKYTTTPAGSFDRITLDKQGWAPCRSRWAQQGIELGSEADVTNQQDIETCGCSECGENAGSHPVLVFLEHVEWKEHETRGWQLQDAWLFFLCSRNLPLEHAWSSFWKEEVATNPEKEENEQRDGNGRRWSNEHHDEEKGFAEQAWKRKERTPKPSMRWRTNNSRTKNQGQTLTETSELIRKRNDRSSSSSSPLFSEMNSGDSADGSAICLFRFGLLTSLDWLPFLFPFFQLWF